MQSAASESSASGGQSWKVAKEIAKEFGYIPASFSIAVRTLTGDQYARGGELRAVTKFQVARILRTPSFKAMLYHATKEFHPEKMEGKERISIGDMMDFYQPLDLAAIIVSFLLYRKIRRVLGDDTWQQIESEMAMTCRVGALVGNAIPKVGLAPALLNASLRSLSAGLLMKKDAKRVSAYLQKAYKNGMNWDSAYETETWGCSTVEIATMVLSTLGFGVDVSQAFALANDPTTKPEHMQPGIPHQFKMAWLWVDCFLRGADHPLQKVPGEYYPMEDARKRLEESIAQVGSGAKKNWLAVGKDDISPELTPQLFATEQVDENAEFEVPEELKDVFSLDQITSMEEDEFDDLIDQMDEENEGKEIGGAEVLSSGDIDELEGLVE